MMTRLVAWYDSRSLGERTFLASLAAGAAFYSSALMAVGISKTVGEQAPGGSTAVHAAVFLVLLTTGIFASRYFLTVRHRIRDERDAKTAFQLHAYAHVDRLVAKQIDWAGRRDDMRKAWGLGPRVFQEIVQRAYETFEAGYGRAPEAAERIDFEVTFMTKSYHDGKITIPAYANRDGRAPRSMVLREKNPDIYDNTVTARIYREQRPSPHIVENTDAKAADYQELYPDQKKRIRSSIVYPVLSHQNTLLGTLVVHCDKNGFFEERDQKYWFDVVEIFAKRLALAKQRLDLSVEPEGGGLPHRVEEPF
jgi:hypothetical protein